MFDLYESTQYNVFGEQLSQVVYATKKRMMDSVMCYKVWLETKTLMDFLSSKSVEKACIAGYLIRWFDSLQIVKSCSEVKSEGKWLYSVTFAVDATDVFYISSELTEETVPSITKHPSENAVIVKIAVTYDNMFHFHIPEGLFGNSEISKFQDVGVDTDAITPLEPLFNEAWKRMKWEQDKHAFPLRDPKLPFPPQKRR